MTEMYVTTVERIDPEHHRSPIIIHDGWKWYFAEFNNWTQLKKFLDFTGLEIKLEEERPYIKKECGTWKKYSVNRLLDDRHDGGFWKVSDLPSGVKKIKGLSNGSIVDCYILNDGKILHVYRPNPNAKEVFFPLALCDHINYIKENGLF